MADSLSTREAAAYLAERGYTVGRRRVGGRGAPTADTIKHWCKDGKFPRVEKRGRDWYIPQADLDRLIAERDTHMIAVEIKLTTGTYRLPMDGGDRILTPGDIRTNWDAWVSDEVDEDQLLAAEELAARHPGIAIDRDDSNG